MELLNVYQWSGTCLIAILIVLVVFLSLILDKVSSVFHLLDAMEEKTKSIAESRPRKKFTPLEVKEINSLRARKWSWSKIARKHGITRSTLRYRLKNS